MTKPDTQPTITLRRDALPKLASDVAVQVSLTLDRGITGATYFLLLDRITAAIIAAGVHPCSKCGCFGSHAHWHKFTREHSFCESCRKWCPPLPAWLVKDMPPNIAQSTAPLPASAGTQESGSFEFLPAIGGRGRYFVKLEGRDIGEVHCAATGGLWGARRSDGTPVLNARDDAACFDSREAAARSLLSAPIPDAPKPTETCDESVVIDALGGVAACGNPQPCGRHADESKAVGIKRACVTCGYSWERCCGQLENIGDRCCAACAHPEPAKPHRCGYDPCTVENCEMRRQWVERLSDEPANVATDTTTWDHVPAPAPNVEERRPVQCTCNHQCPTAEERFEGALCEHAPACDLYAPDEDDHPFVPPASVASLPYPKADPEIRRLMRDHAAPAPVAEKCDHVHPCPNCAAQEPCDAMCDSAERRGLPRLGGPSLCKSCVPVPPAEPDQLQLVSAHPETTCERCHGSNIGWHAPSPLWNAIMRNPATGTDTYGIVCPPCFAELAEARFGRLVWCFRPHDLDVASLWTDSNGRTWDAKQCLWVDPAPEREAQDEPHTCVYCGKELTADNVSDRPNVCGGCRRRQERVERRAGTQATEPPPSPAPPVSEGDGLQPPANAPTETCDWGGCDGRAKTWRLWEEKWLPVCADHSDCTHRQGQSGKVICDCFVVMLLRNLRSGIDFIDSEEADVIATIVHDVDNALADRRRAAPPLDAQALVAAAYALDDKPHLMFSAVRRTLIASGESEDSEAVKLCDLMYERAHRLLEQPLDAQALAEELFAECAGYDGDFDNDGSGAIETKANMLAIIERAAGRRS